MTAEEERRQQGQFRSMISDGIDHLNVSTRISKFLFPVCMLSSLIVLLIYIIVF